MINNLLLLNETYTNGYRAVALDLISLASIFSGNFVIVSKNLIVSCNEINVDTCDSISKLLYDFNSGMGSLVKQTHTDNSKELVNYWLCGTATEINWLDKSCQIG